MQIKKVAEDIFFFSQRPPENTIVRCSILKYPRPHV